MSENSGLIIGAIAALAVVLGAPTLAVYKAYGTKETVTVTVTEKTVKRTDNDDQYMIFTEGEVFKNTDALLNGKFDSSDLYGKIKAGSTCTFKVNGWRIPFFSAYRNILTADCK